MTNDFVSEKKEELLKALDEAILTGAKKIKFDGKEIEYQTLDEMLKVRRIMTSEKRKRRKTYVNVSFKRF